jgi:hypothetical protein
MSTPLNEKQKLDEFTVELFKAHAVRNNSIEESPSPFFMAKLNARIEAEGANNSSIWEYGLLATRRFLVFSGLVAFIFFASSMAAFSSLNSQSSTVQEASYSSSGDETVSLDRLSEDPDAIEEAR